MSSSPAAAVAVSAPAPFHLSYEPSFDGLRGYGILAVMGAHADLMSHDHAVVAMDSFFVLSGFLITSLLVEEWQRYGRISLRDFYMRRVLRLFPALFLVLALWTPLASWMRPDMAGDNVRGALAALFYSANWMTAFRPNLSLGVFSHTWSLSVEEQFYALWPVLLCLLLRLRRRVLAAVMVTALVGIALYRVALLNTGAQWNRLYTGLDTRADALLAGCAAALWVAFGSPQRYRRWWPAAATLSAVIVLLVAFFGHYEDRIMYVALAPLVVVACAVAITSLVIAPSTLLKRVLEVKPIVWIGSISYGLYLWHLPIFVVLTVFHLRLRYLTLAELALTFACGAFSYYFIERRFLRMKKRYRGESRKHGAGGEPVAAAAPAN